MSEFPPKWLVVVGAIVIRDDKVLLVRQTYGRLVGVWSLPSGFVEPPEGLDEAAIREAHEEGGVQSVSEGLYSLTTLDIDGGYMLYPTFKCRWIAGEPVPDGTENDAAAFFSLDDLANATEPLEPLSRWLCQKALGEDVPTLPPVDSRHFGVFDYLVTFVGSSSAD